MFLKNTWYVACSSDELTDRPLGRTLCNEAVVLYRPAADQVAALEDFCPHRGAPLSLGRVQGGKLVCGYHGLEMGCQGKTVAMPGQRVQSFPAIRTFPVAERYGFVWFWPGDPALADETLIPHQVWFNHREWAYGGGYYRIQCDYRLMVDNLMDLTHETYVHATSIGQREIDETPCQTTVEGEEVITSRHMEKIMAPPFWRAALRAKGLADDVPVDRWQICRFTPPSHIMIEVGVAHAGMGGYDAPDSHKVYSVVTDFITPETDTSIHYFWGMARRFNPSDAALTDQIRQGQGQIFAEDMEMLQRQQANLLRWPERRLLKLNIDAGGVHARRIIGKLMAAETGSAAPTRS